MARSAREVAEVVFNRVRTKSNWPIDTGECLCRRTNCKRSFVRTLMLTSACCRPRQIFRENRFVIGDIWAVELSKDAILSVHRNAHSNVLS